MHAIQAPPWRSKGVRAAKAGSAVRIAIEDDGGLGLRERPRGGFAIISACVLGTEFTRVAFFAGLLAVEFASAAARSDESLFYGLQTGRKITGFMMMTVGMCASSIAAALLSLKPPTSAFRDTTLAAFFMVFSISAFVEIILMLGVVSMTCNQLAAYNGDEAAVWTCDRAPTFLALGVPLGLPTLGGRLAIMMAAYRGREASSDDFAEPAADDATDMMLEQLEGRDQSSPQMLQSPASAEVVILAPAARHRADLHNHRKQQSTDMGDSDGETDDGRGRERSSLRQQRADQALAKCAKACEELETKASATSAAMHGLDMYAKSLGVEVRRLTGMVDAHVTHRKALESRISIAEQRSPSPDNAGYNDLHVEKLRNGFENVLNEQMNSIRQQNAHFAQQLQEVSAAAHAVGIGKAQSGMRSFQGQLIEAIALPHQQQHDANKLALKLLRQASEVAAILCAQSSDSDTTDLTRLRAKYKSSRELKDLVKTVIYDKIKNVVDDTGHYGTESVERALQLQDDDSPQLQGSHPSDSPGSRRNASVWNGRPITRSASADNPKRRLFGDTHGSQSAHPQPYAQEQPRMPMQSMTSPQLPVGISFVHNPRTLGTMPGPPAPGPREPPRRQLSPTSPGQFHAYQFPTPGAFHA